VEALPKIVVLPTLNVLDAPVLMMPEPKLLAIVELVIMPDSVTPAVAEMPAPVFPETWLWSTVKAAKPVVPVVLTVIPLLLFYRIRELVTITRPPPEPVGWIWIPPPVAPLPFWLIVEFET
jgi:hypothetical protein